MCSCAGLRHSVQPALHTANSLRSSRSPALWGCLSRLLVLCLCALLIHGPASMAVSTEDFFPFGQNRGDKHTTKKDDGGSGSILLTVDFRYFGRVHRKIFVNNNGVMSFNKATTVFNPQKFPQNEQEIYPIIAPYWADVNNENTDGMVWYRETRDSAVLNQATRLIRGYNRPVYKDFRAYWAFVATWEEVGFYGASNAGRSKKNTFQAVLVLDITGTKSFVIINYAKLEWTTGGNSEGDPETGLGGRPAQAGFDAGDKTNFYEIEGARTDAVINLTLTSNVGEPGRWIFRIDSSQIQNACSDSDSDQLFFQPSFSSMLGGELLAVSGPCFMPNDYIHFASVDGEEVCCFVGFDGPRCLLPTVYHTGKTNISFDILDRGSFSGLFDFKNVMDVSPRVRRLHPESWVTGTQVEVLFDGFPDFEEADEFILEILEFKNGSLHSIIKSTHAVSKKYKLEIPASHHFQGEGVAVVKVTAKTTISHYCPSLFGPSIYSDVFPVRFAAPSDSASLCSHWLESELTRPPLTTSGYCPCTLAQAEGDTAQFLPDPLCHKENGEPSQGCLYRSLRAQECRVANLDDSSSSHYVCCYDKYSGELLNVLDGEGGGTIERHSYRTEENSSSVPFLSYMSQDVAPRLHCCDFSANQSLCDQYLQLRQPIGCQGYSTPAAAQAAGDPHMVTLDGKEYTFNGVGEFTLLKVVGEDTVVQVKTKLAVDEEGGTQNASVFSAVALQASLVSEIVEVSLDPVEEDTGFTLKVNAERQDLSQKIYSFDDTTVYINTSSSGNTEVTVVLETIGLSVLIEVTPDLLNIMVVAGSQLKDKLEGLLGNYDSDPTNDLMARNGTLLDPNAGMRDIHYSFGMTWEVPSNESLFAFMPINEFDRLSRDESKVVYIPIFLDEIIAKGVSAKTLLICGTNKQCIYDYEITGKETIAKSTLSFNQKFEARKEELKPVIRCPFVMDIANGNHTLDGRKIGDNATFQCEPGYVMIGGGTSFTLTCQDNGEWNGVSPVCVVRVERKKEEFPLLYVAIGSSAAGFLLLITLLFLSIHVYKKCSYGIKKSKDGSDIDMIELPTLFPISDVPSPVFENPVFVSSLQKLSKKGSFHIPRPTYVDPNIYTEYF